MLQLVSSAFQSFVDLFVVTAPKLDIEPLPDTADEAGEVYRLTEPSGEYRDVYVRRRWEKDEQTGKDVAIADLASPATEYVIIHSIDRENLSSRGRPTVDYGEVETPLSFEDHEALVGYFEDRAKKSTSDFLRKVTRLYPPTPTGDTATTKTALELKL